MKIALVRGDFAAPGEFPNFIPLTKKHDVILFTGLIPVWKLKENSGLKIKRLPSPVDLNLGKISKILMAILNRLFKDAHVLFGLEEELKGFDIAHTAETYYSYTQQCIKAKEKGYVLKVVSTVWENIPHNNEGIRGRKEFKLNSFKNVDLFLPVTNTARKVLIEEGCPKEKIIVMKPGIDVDFFKPQKITSFANIKKDRNIKIIFVGRLIADKGILEILDIFQKMQKKYPKIELIISGQGDLEEEIGKKIENEKLENVRLLGKVSYDDMPKVYNLCDIFVHYPIGSKTWSEQYGMVLIEAMACGLPIVALDRGSIKEVVGQSGLVSNEKNFPKNLEMLIENRKFREGLSKKARRNAITFYDATKYARKLEKIYNGLLAGSYS